MKFLLKFFGILLPISSFKYFTLLPGSFPLAAIPASVIIFANFAKNIKYKMAKEQLLMLIFLVFLAAYFVKSLFVSIHLDNYILLLASIIRVLSYLAAISFIYIGYTYLSKPENIFFIYKVYKILFVFGLIQALSNFIPFLENINEFVRTSLLKTTMGDWNVVTLLAQEPSFVSFQIIFFLYLLDKLSYEYKLISSKQYKFWMIITIILAVFSKSLTVFIALIAYLFFKNIKGKKIFIGLSFSFVIISLIYILFPDKILRFLYIDSDLSFFLRFSYFKAQLYMFLDSYGLGYGLGEYTNSWREIFDKYDFMLYSPSGFDGIAIAYYDKYSMLTPWSILMGMLAEGGVFLGGTFILIIIFAYLNDKQFRYFVPVIVLMMVNAYSPSQPYLLLVLGSLLYDKKQYKNIIQYD